MIARRTLILAAIVWLVTGSLGFAETADLPPLRVSENHHYFVKADGTPFFWQADTAWSIFNHPTPDEVNIYLDDRAAKGFNVIQGVTALWDYNSRTNPDGELPFKNRDLGQINEAYYKNVDAVLDKVAAHGMYMAILPYWHKNAGARLSADGIPEKMKAYCRFLAARYARRPVIWILGGDSTAAGPTGPSIQHITDLEAQGLHEGATAAGVSDIMISYHPTGKQSSSFWFQDRPWLDFNSIQSGHFINTTNFQLVANDFAKVPVKPTLDMEPGYENITNNLVRGNPNAPRIKAVDVRRSAYLAVFAGAAGHTYGNGEVYEFWSPEKKIAAPVWAAGLPFRESLKLPGSGQIQFVRYLIESRPPLLREPDNSLIAGEISNRATERDTSMLASDGSYAFVYIQGGLPVTVNTGKLSGMTISAWWYDPRTGDAKKVEGFAKVPSRQFTPPHDGENDWVLVLDDAAKNFGPPGKTAR